MVLANPTYMNTVHDRIFGDIPAKNTVYTPFIYGSCQPYSCNVLLLSPADCDIVRGRDEGGALWLCMQ